MIKGDTPQAACFNSPEEPDYRTPAHGWRCLKGNSQIEVCDACGAMRKAEENK